jgi:hypothetical protein
MTKNHKRLYINGMLYLPEVPKDLGKVPMIWYKCSCSNQFGALAYEDTKLNCPKCGSDDIDIMDITKR